jgi:alkylation response protein AidB-like acyl-CoA dehydrogenase
MQKKENFFTDNPDIAFHLAKRTDFEKIFAALTAGEREALAVSSVEDLRETTMQILEALGEICGSVVAPNAAKIEQEPITLNNGEVTFPPSLNENVRALIEVGCASMGVSPEYGGLSVPFFVQTLANEMIMRACPSTGLNIVWYASIAHIIELFGTPEIKQLVLPKIATGEWSGSMALTEPDAGSDLAALRSYGERQDDGTWKLFGTKRFISNGCSQVGLVLAMNKKGATGLHNLNLYLCLRQIDDQDNYRVTKIEDKLGLHGSATCELTFDGATAQLLGEENQGFRHMLQLMNDARIAVGFQGLGLMEAVGRLAGDFASQRKTWGKPIAQHELIAEKLLDMEVETKAVRSLCHQAALAQSMIFLAERQLRELESKSDAAGKDQTAEMAQLEKDLGSYRRRVRRWTPLIKWYVAEKAVDMARVTLQIHGGYGYTKEYRAEWWMRESLILPIYEGTSQIQALMCIKDTLKDVIRKPRQFIEVALGNRLQALRDPDPLRKKLFQARQIINSAIVAIMMRLLKANVRASFSDAKAADLLRMVKILSRDLIKMENISPALLHAERLCEMKALVALADALIKDAAVDQSRRWLAERFLNKSMPRLKMLKEEIEMDDPVIAERLSHEVVRDRKTAAAAGA